MSAMVEVWVGEITKLGEKVLARKPFLFTTKEAKGKEGAVEKEQQQHKKKNKETMEKDTSSAMSEATVCLLMDRFVPW